MTVAFPESVPWFDRIMRNVEEGPCYTCKVQKYGPSLVVDIHALYYTVSVDFESV